jgi:hypothetical protein
MQLYGSIRCRLPSLRLLFFIAVGVLGLGCQATFQETYYLSAHDPHTEVTNYFRINVNGTTSFSKAKYSVGFYDRSSVEELFGETAIQRDYLASRVELFDARTKEELTALAEALKSLETRATEIRAARLRGAAGTLRGLLELYRVRLRLGPNLASAWHAALADAEAAQTAVEAIFQTAPATGLSAEKVSEAERHLRRAQVILEGIRIAVDGSVIVRFFDGAGNDLPFDKTLVIFCATDISRFAKALGDLAESKAAQEDLLLAVFGKRIEEAAAVAQEVKESDAEIAVLDQQLGALVEGVVLPGPRKGADDKPLPDDKLAENRKADLKKLKELLLKAATAVSGKGTPFKTAEEIRGFVAGSGGSK